MDIFDGLTMIGGLSLFLFGMSIMGQELTAALAALSASYDKLAQSNASLMDSIAQSTQALEASTERQANE